MTTGAGCARTCRLADLLTVAETISLASPDARAASGMPINPTASAINSAATPSALKARGWAAAAAGIDLKACMAQIQQLIIYTLHLIKFDKNDKLLFCWQFDSVVRFLFSSIKA
jgi:hypothetical protein